MKGIERTLLLSQPGTTQGLMKYIYTCIVYIPVMNLVIRYEEEMGPHKSPDISFISLLLGVGACTFLSLHAS